jgi:serine/threonine protein kinase
MKTEEALAKYELHGELGKGAYGIVRMAIEKNTKEKYAVKIYEKGRLD